MFESTPFCKACLQTAIDELVARGKLEITGERDGQPLYGLPGRDG